MILALRRTRLSRTDAEMTRSAAMKKMMMDWMMITRLLGILATSSMLAPPIFIAPKNTLIRMMPAGL